MASLRVVVVNYEFPPAPSVGGLRWVAMEKYLARLGHGVSVLTTNAFGRLADDEEQGIVRTADLSSSSRLRRILRRPSLESPNAPATDTAPPLVITSVVVPDIYAVTWAPFAASTLRRLIRQREIDVVVSSSPKDSAHLVGLATAGTRAAWVAEFRDGWSNEGTRPPFPSAPQRALDRKLEAWIVRRADAVVAVTDELAADFRARYGVSAICVPNGWDPELAADSAADVAPRERPVRLVYTGTLTGVEGAASDRSPVPLLEAFRLLEPETGNRIELVVAGRLSGRDEAILDRFSDLGALRHIGVLSRAESMALQRSADALLLITGEATASPAKLFEYLGAGRPVLHLGRPGAAARILGRTGAGVTVEPNDAKGIAHQLELIASGAFAPEIEPHSLDRFSYPAVAERMAEVLAAAAARRSSRR